MALLSLFDDFAPRRMVCPRHGRKRRSVLTNLLGDLEDEIDQKVGSLFRRLPSLLVEFEDNGSPSKKRKMEKKEGEYSEPKTTAVVSTKDNRFQVQLDTSNFSPDDIMVKVIGDKIAVSAKHEAKTDDVYEYNEMYRVFDVPEGVDPDNIASKLTANGQLTIEAPARAIKDIPAERTVRIEREESATKEKETQATASKVDLDGK